LDRSQQVTPKYVVRASFEVKGVVEKSDIVGALFGQTEGLFGPDLDLRELQKNGRIGRIEIESESKRDKTTGTIVIPSNLDRPSTSLIAAAIESVDRVGPCEAKVTLDKLEDFRETKREAIIHRAKDLLQKWTIEDVSTTGQVLKEVSEVVRPAEITKFGPEGLPAGPEITSAESIIIVEGRADVGVLLKSGIKNVIAVEGTSVPETVIKLSREKEATAFLDGDRGGDIILKELQQVASVDYVARAPRGKEVEDLTPKDVLKALQEKVPIKRIAAPTAKRMEKKVAVPDAVKKVMTSLKGTLEAVVLNDEMEPILRAPVGEIYEKLKTAEGAHTVVFDGVITQRIVDVAAEKGIKRLIGDRVSDIVKRPIEIQLLTAADIGEETGNKEAV